MKVEQKALYWPETKTNQVEEKPKDEESVEAERLHWPSTPIFEKQDKKLNDYFNNMPTQELEKLFH
jgi:hypothetical protein